MPVTEAAERQKSRVLGMIGWSKGHHRTCSRSLPSGGLRSGTSRTYSCATGSIAMGPSYAWTVGLTGYVRGGRIRPRVSRSSGVRSRPCEAAKIRRSSRRSSGDVAGLMPCTTCGSSQCGHGSSAGHSSGPPIELSCHVGAPGRGCRRVAVRASGASRGKTTATSIGRGGVTGVTFMAAILPIASDSGPCGPPHAEFRHGRHPGERHRRSVAGRRPASRSTIAAWLSVHARGSSPRTTWTGTTLTRPFRPGRRRSGDGPHDSSSAGRGRPLEVEHLADGEVRGRPWCRPTGREGEGEREAQGRSTDSRSAEVLVRGGEAASRGPVDRRRLDCGGALAHGNGRTRQQQRAVLPAAEHQPCRARRSLQSGPMTTMTTRTVEYPADGLTMIGHLALPAGVDRRPAVLLGPEGTG